MLTRHFYESEEVEAALLYAIVRGRHVEAAFWCEELVCSLETARAWGILTCAWLEQCLVVLPDWADTWLLADTGTDIHEACAELCDACRTRRDCSLPLLLLLGAAQKEGGPPEGVPGIGGSGCSSDPLLDYFLRACKHGKGVAAWWAAQQLGARLATLSVPATGPRLFSLLEILDLPGNPSNWRAVFMCAAILLECLGGLGLANGLCGKYVRGARRAPAAELAEWRALEGRRARRVYPIPRECLLCVTPRGRTTTATNSFPLLYSAHERIQKGEGCKVWQQHTRCIGESEEALEAFHAFAFPDDIPDEWSKEAHLQSHGPGTLARGEEPRWAKWARLWLEADALFVWGSTGSASVSILTPPTSDTRHWLDSLYATKRESGPSMDDPAVMALLAPVRKMRLVGDD